MVLSNNDLAQIIQSASQWVIGICVFLYLIISVLFYKIKLPRCTCIIKSCYAKKCKKSSDKVLSEQSKEKHFHGRGKWCHAYNNGIEAIVLIEVTEL